MAQIQEIDRRMMILQRGLGEPSRESREKARVTFSKASPRRQPRPRAKRGALKERIVQTLRAAGRKGATIRELSSKLGVPSANLYVWFNGTGKNVRGIKKIGVARYRLL